jgi:hypothetical protein
MAADPRGANPVRRQSTTICPFDGPYWSRLTDIGSSILVERRGELGCTQESRRGASTIPDQSCAMLYTSVIACANRGAVV